MNAEQRPKGATVKVPDASMGVGDREYPKARSISVSDGHLFIRGSGTSSDVIAIYAPGKWYSVDLEK